MRADRLVAATLHLQRRGRVTAAELAEHLDVSVATARRDLEALSSAGIPVYPQQGRGGGWQLVGGARTDLTGLTESEVRALFLALGSLDLGGTDGAGTTALSKLVRALPEPFREDAEIAASALRRDATRWEERAGDSGPVLAELQEAVLRRRACTIDYRRRGAQEVRRTAVEPWRLVQKAGISYLLGGTGHGARTYRVDRIEAVTVHEGTFERPADGELDRIWQEAAAVAREARTSVSARIRTDATALRVLADLFGAALTPTDVDGEAIVAAHSERGLAEQLAGWGGRVRVLDAPGVAAELRAIGEELVQSYRT